MFGLLPFIALALLAVSAQKKFALSHRWREAILLGATAWGTLLVASTEILSLFKAISFWPILLFWVAVCGLNIFWLWRAPSGFCLRKDFHSPIAGLKKFEFNSFEYFSLGSITFILILTGLIALVAPPNTWDSMTYHISRVVHWIQNETLSIYPTSILRQLNYPPFAEYAILHLQILTGSDRLANIVQWLSFLGSLLAVSLIAREIGANRRGQMIAALLTATIPLAILESSGTQNDLVVSFWLTTFAAFLLLAKSPKLRVFSWAAGLGLGLALLTKGTAYFFGLPFLLVASIKGLWTKNFKTLAQTFLILGLALLLNTGYFTRNYTLNQQIMPSSESGHLGIGLDWRAFTKNLTWNLALHASTFSTKWNNAVESLIAKTHARLGIDLAPTTISMEQNTFHIPGHPFHEDIAGNFVHSLLIILVFLLGWLDPRFRKSAFTYASALLLGAIIFTLLLKWSSFHTRYHLPWFILAMPLVGIFLNERLKGARAWFLVFLFILALPWVFCQQSRPLLGKNSVLLTPRLRQYFANQSGYPYSYIQAAKEVQRQKCSNVGVIFGSDSWEYPLWVALAEEKQPRPRIEHVLVDGAANKFSYPQGAFQPCLIITDTIRDKLEITVGNQTFVNIRRLPFLAVFQPDATGQLARQLERRSVNEIIKNSQLLMDILANLSKGDAAGPDSFQKIFLLANKIQNQAVLLDQAKLNDFSPELGDAVQQKLLPGIQKFLDGFQTRDEKYFIEGQKIFGEWLRWLSQHHSELNQHVQ